MFALFQSRREEMVLPVIALIVIAVLVGLDQLIKIMVLNQLQPVGTVELIPNVLDLTYVENYGAAFGILQNFGWLFIILTSILSVAFILGLFLYKNHSAVSYIASILIVAGGIGNLIDRIFYGFVVDYIHFQFSFFPFVFNLADCCVTIGTVLILIHILFLSGKEQKYRGKKKNKKMGHSETESMEG